MRELLQTITTYEVILSFAFAATVYLMVAFIVISDAQEEKDDDTTV